MAVPLGSAWLSVSSDFNATFSDGWSANFSKFSTSITGYKKSMHEEH